MKPYAIHNHLEFLAYGFYVQFQSASYCFYVSFVNHVQFTIFIYYLVPSGFLWPPVLFLQYLYQ